MNRVLLTSFIISISTICNGFRVHSTTSRPFASQSMILSSNQNSNLADFAKPEPVAVKEIKEDEVPVDLDALAEESSFRAFQPKSDISDMIAKERKTPREAGWFPFLLSPAALDGSYAGDVGFDPLGFAPTKAVLTDFFLRYIYFVTYLIFE